MAFSTILRKSAAKAEIIQKARKLRLCYGNLAITKILAVTKIHGGTKRSSCIPYLLNLETRLDVILVRIHFCETIPQARQLISHGKVCVNNGVVNKMRLVSHGDIISLPTTNFIGSQKAAHFSTSVFPRFAVGRRFFSTSAAFVQGNSSDKKLLDVVQSEIEVAEHCDDHGKTVVAPADFPFSIVDNPREQTVTLSREYNLERITVEVSMPNLVTGEEDEGEDDDDEEPRTDSSVPLLITVTKKDENSPYLEFDCTAFPDEIRINGLSLKNPETEDQLAYEGPDFFDLDENLQKAFHKYLEIRGVKPSTTNFLHEYMIEKDNKEYVKWLKDVKTFVEA